MTRAERLKAAAVAARRGMLVAAAQWQGMTARFMGTAYSRLREAEHSAQRRAPRSKLHDLLAEAAYFINRAQQQLHAKAERNVRPLLDKAEELTQAALRAEA